MNNTEKEDYYKLKIQLLETERTCIILGRLNSEYFQLLNEIQKYQEYDWYDIEIFSKLPDLKDVEVQLIGTKQQLRNCQNAKKTQLKRDVIKWQEEHGKDIENANGSEENFQETKEKELEYIDMQINYLCEKRIEGNSVDDQIYDLIERKRRLELITENSNMFDLGNMEGLVF